MNDEVALTNHRCHDYRALIKRWRAVARRCGSRLQRWHTADEVPLFFLKTRSLKESGGLYISAGIHGDEPAATEALIAWAEAQGERLRDIPVFLFPCLNPWGLMNNCRFTADGNDLNRLFHREDLPFVMDWRRVMSGYQFKAALMLHEDYDGQGLYLYEVYRKGPFWGEALVDAARAVIPIEQRVIVDGRKSKAGLIRRRTDMPFFGRMGFPEAIWLHMHHSGRNFTVETPSEFALPQRCAAHIAVIEECVRRLGSE